MSINKITLKGNLKAYPDNCFGESWDGNRLTIQQGESMVIELREDDQFKFFSTDSTDPYRWFTTDSFGRTGIDPYVNNFVGKGEAGFYRISFVSKGHITFAKENDLMPSTDKDTRKWIVRGLLRSYHQTWNTNNQNNDLVLLPEGGNFFSQKIFLSAGDELKISDCGNAWIGFKYLPSSNKESLGFSEGTDPYGIDPNIAVTKSGWYLIRLHTGTDTDFRPFALSYELL